MDKKQLMKVENKLQICNKKLEDLHEELRELEAAQLTRSTSIKENDGDTGNYLVTYI